MKNNRIDVRKMISMALAILMIIGMIPVGALVSFADQQIKTVEVSGFAEPDYGAAPETRDDLIISSSAPYTLHTYAPWGIIWYDAETGNEFTGDQFGAGSYYALIILKAKSGYTFGNEINGVSGRFDSITINGRSSLVDQGNSYIDYSGERLVVRTKTFTTTTPESTDIAASVNVGRFTAPRAGQTAAEPNVYNFYAAGCIHVTGSVEWFRTGGGKLNGAFQNGVSYYAVFTLVIGDQGRYFPASVSEFTSLTVNNKEDNVNISGCELTNRKTLRLRTRAFRATNDTPITEVSLGGFAEPVPGNGQGSASSMWVPSTAHYSIVSVTWKNYGRTLSSDEKYVNNTEYVAFIEVKPDSGYCFLGAEYESIGWFETYSGGSYEILIDGANWKADHSATAVLTDSGNLLIATKSIYASNNKTYITDIAIEGFDIPYVEMGLPGGEPYAADDAPYVVASATWFDNDLYCDPGTPYGVDLTVDAKRGYCFKWIGPDVGGQFDSYTVNGSEFLADDYIVVEDPTRASMSTKGIKPNYVTVLEIKNDPVINYGESASANPPEAAFEANASCSMTASCWIDAETGSVFTGTFAAGHSYIPCYTFKGSHTENDVPEDEYDLEFFWEYLGEEVLVIFPNGSMQVFERNEDWLLVVTGPAMIPYRLLSGTVGNCTWTYNEQTGVFTVSGSGTFEFSDDFGEYLVNAKTFIVEDGVTGIGDNILLCSGAIEKVVLADSVQTVGEDCFQTCDRLTDLTLSQGLVSVGSGSFSELPITSLSLPASLRTVGDYAFSYLQNLTSLTIAYGLETVGDGAFSGCTILPDVRIPRSVTSIGEKSFGYDTVEDEIIYSFEIYGYTYSAAHYYAAEYGFLFHALDDAGNKFYVVGDDYPFGGWTAKPGFDLSENDDGTFSKDLFSSEENYEQQFKILEIDAQTLEETLHGKNGTNARVFFRVLRTGWFTIHYDPSDGRIWLTGDNVEEFVPGDINGDGAATIEDVTSLLNSLSSGDTDSALDINGDGEIDIKDVTALLNILAEAE